jgi:hypothetical protein
MEGQEGTPPIGMVRKVLLVSGVFLFAILSLLILTVYPSRDHDFWFAGLSYMIWTSMIVGVGRHRARGTGRWWLHIVPGSAVGILSLVYLSEAFQLQPNTPSIFISISGLVLSILARLASTRVMSGSLLLNNLFLAGAFVSFLFPTLYLSHLDVYNDPIDPVLIAFSTGLVGLAPVYALLSESIFASGRRTETHGKGRIPS